LQIDAVETTYFAKVPLGWLLLSCISAAVEVAETLGQK
jgi:hypothetical protein